MPLKWWWDWGVGYPTSIYTTAPSWTVGNTGSDLKSTTNLASPGNPTRTPGEVANARIRTGEITTPILPGGPYNKGWWSTRLRPSGFRTTNSILRLMDGVTERVRVRGNAGFGNAFLVELLVNGTSVGVSTNTVGGKSSVMAVQFDLSLPVPEAGLWLDGVNEIPVSAGAAPASTFDRAAIGSCDGGSIGACHQGLQLFFDALADDGSNPNYWGVSFIPNTVTDPDASWSFSTTSLVADVGDKVDSTFVQTTTDPDTITYGFQNTTDILAGWNPSVILGVSATALSTAVTIVNSTVDLTDGVGSASLVVGVASGIEDFFSTFAPLNSLATPWTDAQVDAMTVIYSVAS